MAQSKDSSVGGDGLSDRRVTRQTSNHIDEILNNLELCDRQGIKNPLVILNRASVKILSIGTNNIGTRQTLRTLKEICNNILLQDRMGIRNPEVRITRLD